MKKLVCLLLVLLLLFCATTLPLYASDEETTASEPVAVENMKIDALSAVLMEAETGTVLFSQNPDESLPPASVTKIMTLLLVMEAIESGRISLDDKVSISENAASMGGSQVFLETGEEFSVRDLIKCTVISSANDAAVALAEFVSGSEEAFVDAMNARAAELDMTNTHFENATGLDDTVTHHTLSALDIARMSRELIRYPLVMEFCATWMDSIRDGAFTLTNTNRLVRYYPGATGLKTGSTSKAKFCISATAKKDGMTLIAVVMGAPTRDIRNTETMRLLDFGFANYSLYRTEPHFSRTMEVKGGTDENVICEADDLVTVLKKGTQKNVTVSTELPPYLSAPVEQGQVVGHLIYRLGDEVLAEKEIVTTEAVPRMSFGRLFLSFLKTFLHPA